MLATAQLQTWLVLVLFLNVPFLNSFGSFKFPRQSSNSARISNLLTGNPIQGLRMILLLAFIALLLILVFRLHSSSLNPPFPSFMCPPPSLPPVLNWDVKRCSILLVSFD